MQSNCWIHLGINLPIPLTCMSRIALLPDTLYRALFIRVDPSPQRLPQCPVRPTSASSGAEYHSNESSSTIIVLHILQMSGRNSPNFPSRWSYLRRRGQHYILQQLSSREVCHTPPLP
ncbi:hypothetical protein BDV11DRAFT_156590 [Aspergillus similis]